jgi:SAM-dependent methyltransferase
MLTCPSEPAALPCPCCLTEQRQGLDGWHHICPNCAYESAQFSNAINLAHASLSESRRADGLRALRESNFRELLRLLNPHLTDRHQRLLEVGCGHGWFLELAAQRFAVVGIEPDEQIFQLARAKGLPVVAGYFPAALRPEERFDVMVFNDVLEHIPDPQATLLACHAALSPGGLLVLNLPTSKGLFYVLAKVGRRLGLDAAFERLWQKGFPSPHLHYFDRSNLARLLQGCGFLVCANGSLPSIRLQGLYNRIAYASPGKPVQHGLLWLALLLCYPLVKWLPSDAMLVLAVRQDAPPKA